MLLNFLKSKIHRATVTEANLDYIGSISIDESLMKAANIQELEAVHVLNITNGERLITYALYKFLSGAFRSTPTGKLLQAWTNLSESEASPLRTGNLPSGAILKV